MKTITVEDFQHALERAAKQKSNFACTSGGCKWTGLEPLLVDYDARGPHLECPVCRSVIALNDSTKK